uniref:Uncharacterized protein n=1 Tax=Rhizophora mucronata TaxID=61149 RepID=A0A2P2NF57_RHIMU
MLKYALQEKSGMKFWPNCVNIALKGGEIKGGLLTNKTKMQTHLKQDLTK